VVNYHLIEVYQTRSKWIVPDFGYLAYTQPSIYRETFIGGGRSLYSSKRFGITEEVYFDVATGPAAGGAVYFWPWTWVGGAVTKNLHYEAVYFPCIPLNNAGTWQHIIERAKMEQAIGQWRVGAGYAAYRSDGGPWNNKPLVTVTRNLPIGSFEVWAQLVPGNHVQAQFRWQKTFKGKKK
jgi:hypothetical protein